MLIDGGIAPRSCRALHGLLELGPSRERHSFCNRALNAQALIWRYAVAEFVQAFGDILLEIATLGQYLDCALGNTTEIGNVLLLGFAVDASSLREDCGPVNVQLLRTSTDYAPSVPGGSAKSR